MIDDFVLNNINVVFDIVIGFNVEEVEIDWIYFMVCGFDVINFQVDGFGLLVLSGNVYGDIDIVIYERVEVLCGVNGFMIGIGSFLVIINYVCKKFIENIQILVCVQLGSWSVKCFDIDVLVFLLDLVGVCVVVVKEDKELYFDCYELDKIVVYGVISVVFIDIIQLIVGVSQ